MAPWTKVQGFDPIDQHRCVIFARERFDQAGPMFVRVQVPGRIICELQQVSADPQSGLTITSGRCWFGVDTLDDVRAAKGAVDGNVECMRAYASLRSYRFLGRDNDISDVAEFIDTAAALYWFGVAAKKGSHEARVEKAYLEDILGQSQRKSEWLAANRSKLKKLSSRYKLEMPQELQDTLRGSFVDHVCKQMSNLIALRYRSSKQSGFMRDYHRRSAEKMAEQLNLLKGDRRAPKLDRALESFLKAQASSEL